MGATASLQPEKFSAVKEEYERKKDEGLSDEDLFNHMRGFIENAMAESAKPAEEAAAAEAAAPPAEDAPPADAAPSQPEDGATA